MRTARHTESSFLRRRTMLVYKELTMPFRFIRKMHPIVKRSLLGSIVVIVLVVCLCGVLGKNLPNNGPGLGDKKWYEGKDLKLVHVVFRHGHRTPSDTYPNDVHVNETFSPYGWGQLTNQGKEYLYSTGEFLRKRYDDFLGPDYHPDIAHAQATGVTRTKMSLQLALAGLFPPKNTPMEWNKKLNWQPVPYDSEPLDKDTLLLVRTPCPRYYEALDEVFENKEVREEVDQFKWLYDELTEITGLNVTTPDDVQSIYNTLRTEQEYGLQLPAWTSKYYPSPMFEVTTRSYIYNVYTEELKRLKAGPFLSKMAKEWQQKIDSTLQKGRKIYVYAGHDSTVVNVMSGLNVWEEQFPGYGIMGIFELLQDKKTQEYGVQIYLKNSTDTATPLTIPGCEFFCPLDKVLDSVSNVLTVTDRKGDCTAHDASFVEPEAGGP